VSSALNVPSKRVESSPLASALIATQLTRKKSRRDLTQRTASFFAKAEKSIGMVRRIAVLK